MRRYSLLDLEAFANSADAGSVTAGAERMHLSPTSVSIRIHKLEEALGVKLMKRKARGVELTQAGEVVRTCVHKLERSLGDMHRELKPYQNRLRGVLSISANYGAAIDFLPNDISSFLSQRPKVRITLETKATNFVLEDVLAGRADIGIGAFRTRPEGMRFIDYKVDGLVLICRKDHELAERGEVWFKDSLKYDFVSLGEDSSMQKFIFGKAEEHGHSITPRVQVHSQHVLMSLVENGVGIAVASNQAFKTYTGANLKLVLIKDEWSRRELKICASEKLLKSEPLAREFIDFICSNGNS